MNIYQIKTQPEGIERVDLFVRENFICIGYSELDKLTGKSKDEIREEIREKYNCEGSRLGNHLGNVNAFVNTMTEGDFVLITENDWVHIGTVGEYKYDDQSKSLGMCHKRDVVWQARVLKHELNEHVRELLRNRSIITKFKHPVDIAELDKVIANKETCNIVEGTNNRLIEKALNVLTAALDSDNEEVRVKAAVGLLEYYKLK